MRATPTKSSKSDAYQQSVNLLQLCCTADGFLASPTEHDNYRRVWARDGAIISLAALLTDNQQLKLGVRKTLETLAQYQGKHGEIPSNVDAITQRVSYGGTTGDDWKDLQMTFSYTFKNNPYEYHNAGLRPMITGFYVADLAQRGKNKEAAWFLDSIDKAKA